MVLIKTNEIIEMIVRTESCIAPETDVLITYNTPFFSGYNSLMQDTNSISQ